MIGSFEATMTGADRPTVAGWFAAGGWEAAEIGAGNWIARRGGSQLVVTLLRRYDRPVAVRGLLADAEMEGFQVCRVLEAAPRGFDARWCDAAGRSWAAGSAK